MRVLLIAFAVLVPLVLSPREGSAKDDDQVLRVVTGGGVRTLDPHEMAGSLEWPLGSALFEGLTFLDPATLQPVPGAASSWKIEDGGKRYTFQIRPEAAWSDGNVLTANDFAWSLRRALDPARDAVMAYLLHDIRGARAWNQYGRAADEITLGSKTQPSLVNRLVDLRRIHPRGVDRATWRFFVRKLTFRDALSGSPDALVREAARGTRERWSAADLEALEKALRKEADRLRAEHASSRNAFGHSLGVHSRSDNTLVIELEHPLPWLLELLATPLGAPVPRHAVKRGTGKRPWWISGAWIGNGPFVLDELDPNGRVRIIRNEKYWNRKAIRLDAVDVRPIPDRHDALAAFTRDDADWTTNFPLEVDGALSKSDVYRSNPGLIVYFFHLNCDAKALSDVRVRKALALALDRERVIREALSFVQIPATRLVPPGLPGYTPPDAELRHDPARARALLAEAGHPGGSGLPELSLLYNTSESHKKIATAVVEQWRRILGIRVRARNEEWQSYTASRASGSFDIARGGWIGDYADPSTFLEMFTTGSLNNDTGWSNRAFDEIMSRARTGSGKDRMKLLREAEQTFLAQVPAVPLYFYGIRNLVHPHVKGFRTHLDRKGPDGKPLPNVQDLHPFRGLWIER